MLVELLIPSFPGSGAGRLGEVQAGAEGAARAGQDDHPDVRVGVGRQQVLGQLARASAREMVFIRSGRLRVIVAMWSATS